MKTFLSLLLICSLTELQAQTVTLDYQSRKYTPEIGFVQHGKLVSYRIINVNSFAQKVVINGTAISMTTQIPAQLATLFSIEAKAEKELANTGEQVKEMVDVQKTTNDAGLKAAADKLVDSCTAYYEEARKIKDALALEERLAGAMTDKSFYNDSTMTQALIKSSINNTAIGDLKTNYVAFDKAYHKVYHQYQATIRAARAVGDKDKEARIMSALGQIVKDYEALEDQYKKTLFSIDDLFAKATSPDSYEVRSLPLKLAGEAGDADEVKFKVKIDEEEFFDTFDVDGGMKVDFSVGPVANFTADDQYFFDAASTLQRASKAGLFNTITPSVSSMMHVYPRNYKGMTIGGTFGVNAEVKELTDINLGFLAGASAILGKSQKVIISTGVSYLKVNRLKDGQYKVGTVYSDTKIDDVTERVLRPSWFVAVSLSLAKRKILAP